MAANLQNDDDIIANINITPFVDIVLVLLIIFMVTSTAIVKASLKIELPKAASGGETVPSVVNIVLTRDEQLLFNGRALNEDEFIANIKSAALLQPKPHAIIDADKQVAYGEIIKIIDTLKTHGLTTFFLNIERINHTLPTAVSKTT